MKFIGDVVLTTPIIRSLREKFPNAYIAYVGDKQAVSLLEHNPYLNEIIPFDFSRTTLFEQPRVMVALRRRKFDVFIDLFCNPRSALLARASGTPIRIGKEVKGRGRLYTHRIVDDGKPKTAIEYYYQYVQPLGIEPAHRRTEIFLTDDEKREAQNYLKWQDLDLTKPIVGLHPGATWPAKMWQWEKFADLADLVRAKLDAQVVITQGPNDGTLMEAISRKVVGNLLILPVVQLRQLAAIIAQFNVYVANDNGTMHIAAAVGTKTTGIFGPGEENIWFPYSRDDGHAALRKDVPCHPCHLDFCNRTGDDYMECMKLLSVKDVFEEVKKRFGV
ncbi:MAG: glycosyltransferase family 9 protein [Ignavibacteria bacterium]|nr:glycosyltransferase family 9 protein [Ignavibacteria bacterium]